LEIGIQQKNQPLNGNVHCYCIYIPILNAKDNKVVDKKRIISIITKASKSYHEEDQKVLFVYGIQAEVKKQIERNADKIT